MNTSTHLAIAFGVLGGVLVISLCLVLARFKFRKRRRGRAGVVDSKYEANLNQKAFNSSSTLVVSTWGITPVAQPGPGGTRQFLGGLFGLDPPDKSLGWVRPGTEDPATSSDYIRESNFSRASRRSRRSSPPDEEEGGIRPNELGMLEKAEKGHIDDVGTLAPEEEEYGENDEMDMRRSESRLSSRIEDEDEMARMMARR